MFLFVQLYKDNKFRKLSLKSPLMFFRESKKTLISGLLFTNREIDIISLILNNLDITHSHSSIAKILLNKYDKNPQPECISEKGIDAHIDRITHRIEPQSNYFSEVTIKRFFQKDPSYNLLISHSEDLLSDYILRQVTRDLNTNIKKGFFVNTTKLDKESSNIFNIFKNNMRWVYNLEFNERKAEFANFCENDLFKQPLLDSDIIFCEVSKDSISLLSNKEPPPYVKKILDSKLVNNIIFICFDDSIIDSNQHRYIEVDSYYQGIIKILESNSNISLLKKFIADLPFKNLNIKNNYSYASLTDNKNQINQIELNKNLLNNKYKIFLSSFISLIIFISCIYFFNKDKQYYSREEIRIEKLYQNNWKLIPTKDSYKKDIESFNKLVEISNQNSPSSQLAKAYLGILYYWGLAPNRKNRKEIANKYMSEVHDWLINKAESGNKFAAEILGARYTHGIGCEPDFEIAAKYYQIAIKQNYNEAFSDLGSFYWKKAENRSDSLDSNKLRILARKYYIESGEKGYCPAWHNIASKYQREGDEEKAYKYFTIKCYNPGIYFYTPLKISLLLYNNNYRMLKKYYTFSAKNLNIDEIYVREENLRDLSKVIKFAADVQEVSEAQLVLANIYKELGNIELYKKYILMVNDNKKDIHHPRTGYNLQ